MPQSLMRRLLQLVILTLCIPSSQASFRVRSGEKAPFQEFFK